MSNPADPAFIVQVQLAGKWTTALRLASAKDESRAGRTLKKLAEAGHYEAVRILKADGMRDQRTVYRLAGESGPLEVTNPVVPTLQPRPRFRIERRHGNKPWEHAKDLPTRDDAFALALRYHRQDPRGAVRVLEEGETGSFTELMHRKASLGSGAEARGRTANENHSHHPPGMMAWLFAAGVNKRRRNTFMIVACLFGLLYISHNEMRLQRQAEPQEHQAMEQAMEQAGETDARMTGLVSAAALSTERIESVCTQPPDLSVKFFESIRVPPEQQGLLRDYLEVVRAAGSGWRFRQAGKDCYVTLTGAVPGRGQSAPTQIDCRIGDFFFTHFERPAAARAAEDGCRVL